MGAPSILISTNSISLSAQKIFFDLGLRLRYTNLIDLDKKGSLHEIGLDYDLKDDIKVLIALNKIFANNNKIKDNQFINMENFSHIRMEFKFYY